MVDQLVLCCWSTFELERLKIKQEIPGTANQELLRPKVPFGRDKVQQAVEGGEQHVHSRLCAPEQHGSEEAGSCQGLTGPTRESRRRKFAQTSLQVTSLPRPTANAERREVSFIEGTWEETRLLPPSIPVQLGQMKETEDCCGFVITKQNEPSWRVARHGCFQLNKDKMQIEGNRSSGTPPVYIHLCKAQTDERNIRSETAKSYWKHRRTEKRREKRKKESLTRNARRDAGRPDWPW